jgi:hypothetical protein
MCYALVPVLLLVATACHAADDEVRASGTLGGKKVQFPAQSVAEGVKATVALLKSCHSREEHPMLYSLADLKKARQGDHVRLVFAKPIKVDVLEKELEVSELVFTQPLNTGVFWRRCGDSVVRCTKYEPKMEKDFLAWRQQARPMD